MKAISFDDSTWEIFGKELSIHDKLPAKTFEIEEQPFGRFVFKEREDLKVTEKLYGNCEQVTNHIIKGFENASRNMGVILSGDKGLGKTVTAKLICQKLNQKGYPIIIIKKAFDNIDKIITSLEQEVVILFDEFDKTFITKSLSGYEEDDEHENKHNKNIKQMQLLTLLDGTDNGKKLFILTCNDIYNISKLFINRPGRCHYHVRFDYPQENEIRTYLKDNIYPEYQKEINNIIDFSLKLKLNYDCLRAICFEINMGYTFKEAIDILNIINLDEEEYIINVELEDGRKINFKTQLDLFDTKELDENGIRWYNYSTDTDYQIIADFVKIHYDNALQAFTLNNAKMKIKSSNEDIIMLIKNIVIKNARKKMFDFII